MKRVLIVEHDWAVGRMERLILAQEGYDVVVVTSGLEAVRHLRERPADLVLSEWSIGPRMDGLRLCAYLRRQSPHVRFVLCTGAVGQEYAKRFGGVDVLAKPYRLADLRRIVGGLPDRQSPADLMERKPSRKQHHAGNTPRNPRRPFVLRTQS